MNNPSLDLFIGIGGVFGFLAALMAYLITYNEYMHHYQTSKEPRKMALQAAIFAFIFFFALAVGSGYFITHFL